MTSPRYETFVNIGKLQFCEKFKDRKFKDRKNLESKFKDRNLESKFKDRNLESKFGVRNFRIEISGLRKI